MDGSVSLERGVDGVSAKRGWFSLERVVDEVSAEGGVVLLRAWDGRSARGVRSTAA